MADLRGKTMADWFMCHVSVNQTGCWIWQGEINKAGYGRFASNGLALAHRAAWQIFKGDIPDGMFVCHSCDVKGCVNPDHLSLGTPLENSKQAKERGLIKAVGITLENKNKTHCLKGHLYDAKSSFGRYCRKCRNEYMRLYMPIWKEKRRKQWQST